MSDTKEVLASGLARYATWSNRPSTGQDVISHQKPDVSWRPPQTGKRHSCFKNFQQCHCRGKQSDLSVCLSSFEDFDKLIVFVGLSVVQVGHIHAPARKSAETGRFVVNHSGIFVSRIEFDFLIKRIKLRCRTFQYLQKPPAVVKQTTCYLQWRVVCLCLFLYRRKVFWRHLTCCLA
ncbi:hypothetical protein RCH09_000219 [Actimicrobium sp. GrIS 1.19]|nr:hypothetical protein [Actimicrobium sp. GrIS 1.19]